MGVVFDHLKAVAKGNLLDGVHLTGNAAVVHRDDGARMRPDERLELGLVEVERVGANIDEAGHSAAQGKRVGSGDEGEGRHDDLVARLQVEQQRAHLQRVGARGGEHDARPAAEQALEKSLALPAILAVADDLPRLDGGTDVVDLVASQRGAVEGNLIGRSVGRHRAELVGCWALMALSRPWWKSGGVPVGSRPGGGARSGILQPSTRLDSDAPPSATGRQRTNDRLMFASAGLARNDRTSDVLESRMRNALILLFCLPLAAAGCASKPPGGIVLIVIDTLRADHMSLYGYERPTTPRLDELSTAGSVFEHAYSASSWTLPGTASILTGLYPSAHGAGTRTHRRLREGVITLPQYLSGAGYSTGAVVNVSFLGPMFGFATGFDSYDLETATANELRLAEESLDDALSWLDTRDASRPFFLFLHLFDVHHQYFAPEPARGAFTKEFADRYGDTFATIESREVAEQAADVEFLKAAYDEEILAVDSQIGRLFEALQERDLHETTWVALTADHGEAFRGEHYHQGHGRSLYDEVMRVPLVLWGPGVPAGERYNDPVSTVDIVPTLLDMAALEVPELSGGSLMPLLAGEAPPTRPIYARSNYYGIELEAIVEWPYKMVSNRTARSLAIYDLSTDPGELRALHRPDDAQLKRTARRLRRQMRELRRDRQGDPVVLSPELERQLRALGYIQ